MASTRTEVIRIVMDAEEYERNSSLINVLVLLDAVTLHRADKDGACFDFKFTADTDRDAIRDAAIKLQDLRFNAVVAPTWLNDTEGSIRLGETWDEPGIDELPNYGDEKD